MSSAALRPVVPLFLHPDSAKQHHSAPRLRLRLHRHSTQFEHGMAQARYVSHNVGTGCILVKVR
ncbi:hypothetical protein BDV98DRAFT_556944 [Pterulicium gracile]|uniref:Uncharacterized protein n=1 Tax=Pterulicium gracile TaxID=1884261 RepID=A0A5C3R244_9AGAR|nr:hypothetical protein BDV98DRAFT_556944 [Pterula gracilis]